MTLTKLCATRFCCCRQQVVSSSIYLFWAAHRAFESEFDGINKEKHENRFYTFFKGTCLIYHYYIFIVTVTLRSGNCQAHIVNKVEGW
jgi:hypothetical protein